MNFVLNNFGAKSDTTVSYTFQKSMYFSKYLAVMFSSFAVA
jgi:hypothetical protein